MKQLNGETISTSQYLRSAFLLPEPREMMFSLPPEVVPVRSAWELLGASCSRQQASRQPIHVQTTVAPPPGIQSLSGSFYGGKQTTESTSDNASTATASSNGPKGDLYKTELCRTYEECGTCRYGDKCQFAHGFGELRNVSRHPKYKTDLCRTFHTSGFCPYGARCHFIHGEQEKQPQQQQQQTTTNLSSALLRQQQVPAASRRPEVLDLLPASRQNEIANTVSLLLSLTGQNQRGQQQQQQQPAQVRQADCRQSRVQTSSNVSDVATYELLRMMVEQQLSIAQSKSALSPCPSPTISQYGSVCSAGSTDDIPSPVCSPSSSSLSSLSSSYGGNWNAFFKQQASFDSLSSHSSSSGDGASSSSNRRTPPGTPDSPTMHWQDRDIASDFRLWPSVGYSTYDDSLLTRQNMFQTKARSDLLLGSKAVRSIFQ